MNIIEQLVPNTNTPIPNNLLEETKYEAINSLLSFNSQNTSQRLSDISSIVSNSLQSYKPTGFKEINGLIESIMTWLLNTPYIFISAKGNEGLTPHYTHYIKGSNKSKDSKVPFSIASLIQDGCTYTWGGFHGTLGFEWYLSRTETHYLSTSQLSDISIRNILGRLNKYTKYLISPISNKLLGILSIDNIDIDIDIYRSPIDIIQSITHLKPATDLLEGLITINNSINANTLGNTPEDLTESYRELYITLINNPIPQDHKPFHLFHTDISNSLISLGTQVNEWIIKNSLIVSSESQELNEAFNKVKKSFSSNGGINPFIQMREGLIDLPLPGGFNQIIALSALALLNRAYILTHPSKLPDLLLRPFQGANTKYDSLMYKGNTFVDQVLGNQEQEGMFSRVLGMLYLAGRVLRKSNIRDLILMGNNLSYISGWRDTDPTNIIALID